MRRNNLCTEGLVLLCAALSLAIAGCSSGTKDGGAVGSLDANLTLDAGEVVKTFATVNVNISCDGIDPITNAVMPDMNFDVNVLTTEGLDPTDPKDSFAVFQKEGLPPGSCDVVMQSTSEDGATQCNGEMQGIAIQANQTTNVSITLNCVTEARFGGVRVDGTFNQCAEYKQVIISPLNQSSGNDIDVNTEPFDPDGDPTTVAVQFLSATNGQPCGTVTPAAQNGNNGDQLDFKLTCEVVDLCLVLVGFSDDGFTFCDATNDGANVVAQVNCSASQACGDGVVTPPEECDPPDGIFCNGACRLIDPCADPNACPDAPGDCATSTCVGGDPVDNTPVCQAGTEGDGTACDNPPGGTCTGGVCGLCVDDSQCAPATECSGAGTCDPALGCQPGAPINENGACTDPILQLPGTCVAGACDVPGECTNANDIPIINDPGFRQVITDCGFGEFGGGPPVDECLQTELGLSAGCSGCWQGFFNCTVAFCAAQCAADPAAQDCIDCLTLNCQADTEACTGLPVPL